MKKRKKTVFWVVLSIILLIVLLLIITKSYLTIQLLLGNDLIISMNADKENLFLAHDQAENITFSIYATTNPFCRIECESELDDLGKNETIDRSSFSLMSSSLNLKSKQFQFTATKLGIGQDLFRFDIQCRSIKTALCHTNEDSKKRGILISLNYDLNSEEKNFKNDSEERILTVLQKADYLDYYYNEISNALIIANKTIIIDELNENLTKIKSEISNNIDVGEHWINLWENIDYSSLEKETAKFTETDKNIQDIGERLNIINSSLNSEVENYSVLLDSLNNTRQNLEELKKTNVTSLTFTEINSQIKNFNSVLALIAQKSNIQYKENIVNKTSEDVKIISIKVADEINKSKDNSTNTTLCCFANEKLNDVPGRISFNRTEYSQKTIEFKEPLPQCCLFGKCEDCCEECSDKNYPIIFLHGHDFNKGVSAEHSLDAFQSIQEALEKDGYLNAGSMILGNADPGVWGKINSPVTVKASYYFDIYKETGKGRVIETKTDNLDTYTLRLRDIVNLMKYKTGKSKVIIIAHSMGGLVARKYAEVFGGEDIERLILIGTPNNGIDEGTLRYCSVLGAQLECRDMDKTSLFINKLNNAEIKVQVYNLIGIGCKMDNETGDGIVKKSSAYLENAENYYIEGNCNGVNYLHSEILDISKYPKLYETIKETLKK